MGQRCRAAPDQGRPGQRQDAQAARPPFLAKFSIQKAHDNGEFFTPSSLVHEQMTKLGEMNDKLRAARDLLLPRLMSGAIPV